MFIASFDLGRTAKKPVNQYVLHCGIASTYAPRHEAHNVRLVSLGSIVQSAVAVIQRSQSLHRLLVPLIGTGEVSLDD